MSAPLVFTSLETASPDTARLLLETWKTGGVAVYPTDTLYGLGGVPTPALSSRVAALKGRPEGQPFPLLGASVDQFQHLGLSLSPTALALAARFWPGQLTLVVPTGPDFPEHLSFPGATVGIRVPAAPYLLPILEKLGSPIIGTSANPSGHPGPVTPRQLEDWFSEKVELICLTNSPLGTAPSTVVSLAEEKPFIIRRGAMAGEIEQNLRDQGLL